MEHLYIQFPEELTHPYNALSVVDENVEPPFTLAEDVDDESNIINPSLLIEHT